VHDPLRLQALNDWVLATRETAEFRLQTEQMGRSLVEWLRNGEQAQDPRITHCAALLPSPSWPVVFALACALAVDADGGVWPHRYFAGREGFRLGSLIDGKPLDEAAIRRFEDVGALTTPECMRCWARGLCGGGCAAEGAAGHAGTADIHAAWALLSAVLHAAAKAGEGGGAAPTAEGPVPPSGEAGEGNMAPLGPQHMPDLLWVVAECRGVLLRDWTAPGQEAVAAQQQYCLRQLQLLLARQQAVAGGLGEDCAALAEQLEQHLAGETGGGPA
jgi:radical SAM protein with 4Fe4S-binding SPASM domain